MFFDKGIDNDILSVEAPIPLYYVIVKRTTG